MSTIHTNYLVPLSLPRTPHSLFLANLSTLWTQSDLTGQPVLGDEVASWTNQGSSGDGIQEVLYETLPRIKKDGLYTTNASGESAPRYTFLSATILSLQGFAIYFVMSTPRVGNFSLLANGSTEVLYYTQSNGLMNFKDAANNVTTFSNGILPNQYQIVSLRRNFKEIEYGAGAVKQKVDIALSTFSFDTLIYNIMNSSMPLRLRAIMIYTAPISNEEDEQVRRYLESYYLGGTLA